MKTNKALPKHTRRAQKRQNMERHETETKLDMSAGIQTPRSKQETRTGTLETAHSHEH